ncbi:MAG TPA: alpha/beta hydrolase-fold protein [Steroidobacteraceae bacterium]
MQALLEQAKADQVAPQRIALLPGAFEGPQDFQRAGFAQVVRRRGLQLDLVLVHPDPQHLADRSILQRLRRDVVLPARAAGCQSVWLAGISLGGYLALAYAMEFPGEVDGLCLLAPYLGSRIVGSEIARAGGLAAWKPGPIGAEDEERRIWQFIRTLRDTRLSVYLGYGRADRFADTLTLMVEMLPAASVDVVDGGHDWAAWTTLWGNFLDRRFGDATGMRPD